MEIGGNVSNSLHPLFINSIPKSGSHLLTRCISLTGKYTRLENNLGNFVKKNLDKFDYDKNSFTIRSFPGPILEFFFSLCKPCEFSFAHLHYNKALEKILLDLNYKQIFIIRDPRDISVSLANHYKKFESYRLYHFFKKIKDFDEKLKYTITGIRNAEKDERLKYFIRIQKFKKALGLSYARYTNLNLPSIIWKFKKCNGWLNNANFLTVKFEDLIGEVGGGDLETQIKTIKLILNYLEIEISDELIEYISQNVFWKKSKTFNKGQIGTYRDFFKPEHKKLFKEIAGDLLIRLGYEKDDEW